MDRAARRCPAPFKKGFLLLKIYFVSSLPRSGSTLLLNLLGQNPNHHVTPTNDLVEMIIKIRDSWTSFISFKSQGINNVKPRIISSLRGIIKGFFQVEFEQDKVVFDKSRGWFSYIELLEELLQRKVVLLTTVRDIRDIIASFEKLYRKSYLTRFPVFGDAYYNMQTIEGRARQLLDVKSVLGLSVSRMRDVIKRGLGDRLVVIPFRRLTNDPKGVLKNIHEFLDLSDFNYDPENIEQITQENDELHGMELHKIRRKIEPDEGGSWKGILPENLANELATEYRDINHLANL